MSAIRDDLIAALRHLASSKNWRGLFGEKIPCTTGVEVLFRDCLLWAFNAVSRRFVTSIEYELIDSSQEKVDLLIFPRNPDFLKESWCRFDKDRLRALEVGAAFVELKPAYTKSPQGGSGGKGCAEAMRDDFRRKLVPIMRNAQQLFPASHKEYYGLALIVGYYFNDELRMALDAWKAGYGGKSFDRKLAVKRCRENLFQALGEYWDAKADLSSLRVVLIDYEPLTSDPRAAVYAEAILVPITPEMCPDV
jgi:hypothetical protein